LPDSSLLARCDADARLTDGVTTWDMPALRQAVADRQAELDAVGATVVAFDLPNGLDWVALDIALLESGRIAVPIPSFFSEQQRRHAIDSSGAEIFINRSGIERLSGSKQGRFPPGTALVTYTSGSTGTPKGVCLDAATLLGTASSIVRALEGRGISKHLCLLPLTLLLENTAGLFANLINGSEIHVPNLESLGLRGSSEVSLADLVAGVKWHAPHSVIVVPALLLGLTAAAEFGMIEYDSLEFVAVGGGRVPEELLERAATQNLPVYEGYGLTECGSVVAMNTPAHNRRGTVGRLLDHVRARVEEGELIVAHPAMLGVLGDRCVTTGAVATGDRVEMDDDGYLTVHGRLKNVYITAFGRNVSPEWVESELQTELAVAYAIVFGEGAVHATALLVPRGDATDEALAAAVRSCNQRLPDYAQVGAWQRLHLQDLTAMGGLTSNGRIKRDVVERAFGHLVAASMHHPEFEHPRDGVSNA